MYVENLKEEFFAYLTDKRLLLLVNYDVDAICTCKILQHLLRCDHIVYTLIPVQGVKELTEAYASNGNDAKCVILINCGGTIDIVEALQPSEDVVIFILDSHRPIDVCNVYSSDQVKVIGPRGNVPEFAQIFRDDDESGESSSDESDNDDGEDRQAKRQRKAEERILKRRERRQWEEERDKLMFDYTQFTHYGPASALLMFDLANKLSNGTNDLLWWSIVAISDHFVQEKIESTDYVLQIEGIQNQVCRLNPDNDDLETTGVRISCGQELRLLLLRHWTVEESLRYSPYSACALRTWSLKGEKRLAKLLAQMGLPLSQARQKFTAMDLTLRTSFDEMFGKVVQTDEFNLSNVTYPSFCLRHGYRTRVSAADHALALLALLEMGGVDRSPRQRFMDALDALDRSNVVLLGTAIESAKKMSILIFKQVQSLIERRQVISTGPFLFVVLQEGSLDARQLARPHLLSMLAQFTLRAFAGNSTRLARMPLVVSAPLDVDAGTCLMVGVPPVSEDGCRSFFGQAFARAAEKASFSVTADNFNASIVQIPTANRVRFFDALVSLLT